MESWPGSSCKSPSGPQVSHGRFRHPAWVALVRQVFQGELCVERLDIRRAILFERYQLHWALLDLAGHLHQRLEVGVGRVIGRQLLASLFQDPTPPGAHVPGQVGLQADLRLHPRQLLVGGFSKAEFLQLGRPRLCL